MTDDVRANNALKGIAIQSYSATQVTVNDNIDRTGTLSVDTVTSKTAANPVVASDGLTVSNTLTVDTITKRLANEVTVDGMSVVGGTLLAGKIDTSLAIEISILDNVVGSTHANKNLTAKGTQQSVEP